MRMLSCWWLLVIAVVEVLVGPSSAKVYKKCEMAGILERQLRLPRDQIKNFVCIAQYESGFNTAALNRNKNGSKDYGIFQINSMYWCHDDTKGKSNSCGIQCKDLLSDNLGTAVTCAQKILKSQGYKAWVAYNNNCRNRNLDAYMAECW
ncbi:lysozyme C-like [Cherax quadricarinatus]|uniref:lysozyme C-like n=1 Tax=Cherax quadricarinatus TaxID=27406 RepID=UPI00387EA219